MEKTTAYYSNESQSWVRMTRECDGEYCHTSGYATREEALGLPPVKEKTKGFAASGLPDFLAPTAEELAAHYSKRLQSWVRVTREGDGEYRHTSGYATRKEALGLPPADGKKRFFAMSGLPDFLDPWSENQ